MNIAEEMPVIEETFADDVECRWTMPAHNVPPLPDAEDAKLDIQRQIEWCERLTTDFHLKESERPERWGISQFGWLPWLGTRLSACTLRGTPVATGPMSGCWIVTWMERGERKVLHIGTEGDPAANARVKRRAADLIPDDAVGFNPYRPYKTNPYEDPQRSKLIAFVEQNGECYSVLLVPHATHVEEEIVRDDPVVQPNPAPAPQARRPRRGVLRGGVILSSIRNALKARTRKRQDWIVDDTVMVNRHTVIDSYRATDVAQCPSYNAQRLRAELRRAA